MSTLKPFATAQAADLHVRVDVRLGAEEVRRAGPICAENRDKDGPRAP